MNGIILKAIAGFYYVDAGGLLYECKARGSFRKSGVSPLVGDRVEMEPCDEKTGVIDAILPRKNALSRPPVANLDQLLIVSSFENPAPNTAVIDRMTAVAVYHGIKPILLFNKCELGQMDEFVRIYQAAGFPTYVVSAREGEGLEAIRRELQGSVSAFTGNSGVGKSSLLNSLFEGLSLQTGAVSEKLGRGRHTTRHTELLKLGDNTFVADTPGFSSVPEGDRSYDFKTNLIHCFPDLEQFAGGCRFTSCTHTREAGCGVLEALKNGAVQQSRHASYCRLSEELKDITAWSGSKHKKQ